MTLHAPDASLLLRFQEAGRIAASTLSGPDADRAVRLLRRGLLLRCHDDHSALKLSGAGAAAVEAGGRQAKAGRILCLNPKCGRTVDAAKHDADAEIVCSQCWRLVPKTMRDRYRELGALDRKLERRRAAKPGGMIEVPLSAIGLRRRIETNWSEIRDFFLAPEKPEGLETFLAEMGWLEASPSSP